LIPGSAEKKMPNNNPLVAYKKPSASTALFLIKEEIFLII
jgi:hypothetical protein